METHTHEKSATSPRDEINEKNPHEFSYTNNGILEFMTPDRAIELYKRIHSSGPPELEWQFYGRQNPDDKKLDELIDPNTVKDEIPIQDNNQDQLTIPEFDFDEDFGDLLNDTSAIISEGLQLKKRPEPGNEKKTNLSDIMIDIMKEINMDNE